MKGMCQHVSLFDWGNIYILVACGSCLIGERGAGSKRKREIEREPGLIGERER